MEASNLVGTPCVLEVNRWRGSEPLPRPIGFDILWPEARGEDDILEAGVPWKHQHSKLDSSKMTISASAGLRVVRLGTLLLEGVSNRFHVANFGARQLV